MTAQDIITNLNKKIYHPVYLLFGEESYYIDKVCDAIENKILNDVEKEFNQTVVYGRDVDKKTVVSIAKRYPMMSNYQVVIVKEAQDLRDFFPRSGAKTKDSLEVYLEKPLLTTILVFCFKHTRKVDTRRKITKLIKAKGVILESKRLPDYKVSGWISTYIKKRGYSIDDQSSALIAEHLGNDLSKVVNEIEKLLINLPLKSQISGQEIEDNIGISKEYNIFEMQRAIAVKDISKVNRISIFYSNNQADYPIFMIIPMLFRFYLRLLMYMRLKDKSTNNAASVLGIAPFQLQDFNKAILYYNQGLVVKNISILRDFDLYAKGVGSSQKIDQLYLEMFSRLMR